MGQRVGGGGRRVASARAASVWDTIDDVTNSVFQGMFGTTQSGELWRREGIRVVSSGSNDITVETNGPSSDRALDKMDGFERRLKASAPPNRRIYKVGDRERRDTDRDNSYRWISTFRMTAVPRIPDRE